MRSLLASTLCLSLIHQSAARIPQSLGELTGRDAASSEQSGLYSWVTNLFKRSNERRQNVCYEDDFYLFVSNETSGEAFCQAFMNYPDTTETVEYTPKSTIRAVISTIVITHTELDRTTPVSTVTVTASPAGLAKRQDSTDIVASYFAEYEAEADANGSPIDADTLSSSFSSACACQTYTGSTVTETYTDEPSVRTIGGFVQTTTTLTTTHVAGAIVTTVTVTASPGVTTTPLTSVDASTTDSASSTVEAPSTPTGPTFSCPDSNGTTVSQLIGNERFDYLILCDYDYPKEDTFYAELAYNSFAECAAACSMADALFDDSFCQAAVYYPTADADGYNCLLKPSATTGVAAPGVNAAVLQVIAVGVQDATPDGTGTETVASFAPNTSPLSSSAAASSISSLMGNGSSTSIAIITPAPVIRAAQAFTEFSTYVSAGSTYSTGSAFSTYYSGNGSWYYSYYYTYSVAWASATTVYEAGAESTQVAQTNQTNTYVEDNGGNGYVTVTNTTTVTYTYYPTETIANTTDTIVYSSFAANGTFLTASSTIIYGVATYQVGSGGGSGSGGGGSGGSLSTDLTNTTTPVPLSAFSTIFVTTVTGDFNGGGSGGASGGGGGGAGSAQPSSTTTLVTVTETLTSSTLSSTTSSSDTYSAASIPTSVVSVIVNSFGTNGASSYVISGNGGASSISGASSTAASGSGTVPTSTATPSTATPTTATTPTDLRIGSASPSTSTDTATTATTPTDLRIGSASPSTSTDTPTTATTPTDFRIGSASPPATTTTTSTSNGVPQIPSSFPIYVPPVTTSSSSTSSSATTSSSSDTSAMTTSSSTTADTTGTGDRTGSQSPPSTPSETSTTDTVIIPFPPSSGLYIVSTSTSSSGGGEGNRTGSASPPTTTITVTDSGLPSSSLPSQSIPASSGVSSFVPPFPPSSGVYVPSLSSDTYISSGGGEGNRTGSQSPPATDSTTDTASSSMILTSSASPSIPLYPGIGYVPPVVTVTTTSSATSSQDTNFSNENGGRSGSQPYPSSSPSQTAPSQDTNFSNGSGGRTGSQPYPSSSLSQDTFTNENGGRSGSQPFPTTPGSTGTNVGPNLLPPSGLPSSGLPPTGTGLVPPSLPSSGVPFQFSNYPSASLPLLTAPVSSSPAIPTGYGNCTQGTTTVFTTVTLYGCYSQCQPNAAYTAGLQAFGQVPP